MEILLLTMNMYNFNRTVFVTQWSKHIGVGTAPGKTRLSSRQNQKSNKGGKERGIRSAMAAWGWL